MVTETKKAPKKSSPLKKRAKKQLAKTPRNPLKEEPQDAEKLIHEIRGYQVEIEMQNEELLEVQVALEESRSRLADLYDFAPVAYLTLNSKGMVMEANFKAAELLGTEKAALLRTPFSYFIPDNFRDIFWQHRLDSLKHPGKQTCELKLQKKDGTTIDVLMESVGAKDSDGKITQVRTVIWDITEQKRKDEKIRQINAELERKVADRTTELRAVNSELLSTMHKPEDGFLELQQKERVLAELASFPELNPNPVVEVDSSGHVSYLNPAAKRLFPDIEGLGIEHPFLSRLPSVVDQSQSDAKEFLVRDVKVGETWYAQTIFPVKEGLCTRVYSIDITGRKQTEELGKASNEINLIINSTLDFDKIMRRVLPQVAKGIACETAAISLREGDHWTASYIYGFPQELVGIQMNDSEEPHAVLAIRTKKVVVIDDAYNDERTNSEHMKKYGVRSVLVVPLVVKDEAVGVLFLNYHSAAVTFSKPQIDFAEKIGASLSLALENARLYKDLMQSETELRKSRDELEIRIQERTLGLAKINEELKTEIAARKQTEEALRKLAHDLNKRIQEINCLYSTCYQVERQYGQVEEKLRGIVNLLPSGWQYPEIVSARIILDQKEYKTHNFRETPWKQVSEITVDKERMGRVEICYLEEKPKADEGPFLREERNLINMIAVELGQMISHTWADQALRGATLYTRALIEASPDPLVTISRDGKIMDVNKATEQVAGVSRESLIGSDFSNYFTEPEKARKGYQQVFYNGFVKDYPLAICHTSGRVTDVLYNATLYRNEAGEIQGVFAAARDITDRKLAEEKLRESENRLRLLSSELLTVQENERKRIALEIHDSLGQSLTAIKFKVSNAIQHLSNRKSTSGIKHFQDLMPIVQEGIEEARRLQMDLRPPILDDLGILATISWFCRQFQITYPDIQIETRIDIGEEMMPKSLKIVSYRILQEAMNNISKHSNASLVSLSLKKEDGRIALTIQDNGRGFNLTKIIGNLSAEKSKQGLGLTSMRERAELSGGSFAIESAKDKGTTIQVSWPI